MAMETSRTTTVNREINIAVPITNVKAARSTPGAYFAFYFQDDAIIELQNRHRFGYYHCMTNCNPIRHTFCKEGNRYVYDD